MSLCAAVVGLLLEERHHVLVPVPRGCRWGGVWELLSFSRLLLTSALPAGPPVQPPLVAWREEV